MEVDWFEKVISWAFAIGAIGLAAYIWKLVLI